MTLFCFCLSLRTGCLLSVALFVIFAVAKVSLMVTHSCDEGCIFAVVTKMTIFSGAVAIILFNVIVQFIANFMLLVGVFKKDRVCIITFLCFTITGMLIQSLSLLLWYLLDKQETLLLPLAIIIAAEYIPFPFMVRLGILEYREVRTYHIHIVDSYMRAPLQVRRPMPHSGVVPALGFL